MSEKNIYVFHKDRKTDEVIKINYECILNVQHNGWKPGYEVTFPKKVHPNLGNDRGAGYAYLNLCPYEGEVCYNTLWIYEDNLEKAKSLFYDNEIEKLKKEQLRIMRRIETLEKLKN